MALLERGSVWLRHAFLLPITDNDELAGSVKRRTRATSAAFKFTNTSPGGNYAMNNPPQFTHYADIRQPGLGRTDDQWREGMGRYYSEAIDDPKQIVHMSFGVPRFSSWTSFFTNFNDRNAALLANTGQVSSSWYQLGLAGGYVVSLPLQPFIMGFTAVARVYNFLAKNSPSKWYYFSPTMHSYWSAVNTMANELAINMGIIPRIFSGAQDEMQNDKQRTDVTIDAKKMHETYPSIFREDGGIDVMSLARRTERMSYRSREAMKEISDTSTNIQQYRERVIDHLQNSGPVKDSNPYGGDRKSFSEYFKAWVDGTKKAPKAPTAAPAPTPSATPTTTGTAQPAGDLDANSNFSEWSELSGVYEFMTASQRDGSQFVSFRVNHGGAVSESFSNSVRESDIAQELNTKVTQGRNMKFNFMDGNVLPGAAAIKSAITSFAAGALDSVNLGGLATLTGTAFIDIPKIWEGSTANLPRAEYTIPLPSPYGNKISRYLNMMLPISMILAGGLPLSAGRSAYSSPFICQIYHQGRVQIQLGIIDSITISRGTGNVGWNAEHEMLGAEISFSVIDLSSIMHVPIKGGFLKGDIFADTLKTGIMAGASVAGGPAATAVAAAVVDSSVWDEQSTFSDYMSVLASMSLSDIYYVGNRLNLNLTRSVRQFESWRSPSNFMSWALDTAPARVVSAFAQFSDRQ